MVHQVDRTRLPEQWRCTCGWLTVIDRPLDTAAQVSAAEQWLSHLRRLTMLTGSEASYLTLLD